MKYQLLDGRIMSDDELRALYFANKPNASEIAFDFWLYFKIECGAIREVKGER